LVRVVRGDGEVFGVLVEAGTSNEGKRDKINDNKKKGVVLDSA